MEITRPVVNSSDIFIGRQTINFTNTGYASFDIFEFAPNYIYNIPYIMIVITTGSFSYVNIGLAGPSYIYPIRVVNPTVNYPYFSPLTVWAKPNQKLFIDGYVQSAPASVVVFYQYLRIPSL